MGAIFTTFGIDWHLLLINAVNFGLLLAGLTYFLYKPLGKMLEERRQKVAQGVLDAETAAKSLEEIEASRSVKLAEAGREADDLISQAKAAATAKGREAIAQAEAAAARTLKEGEAQAKALKEQAVAESREEIAKLVVLGIEKTAAFSGRK